MVRADGTRTPIQSTGVSRNPRGVNRYAARSMALDPQTPVVVGVGQVMGRRPTPAWAATERPEPLELMTAALLAAAEDCDGVGAGASAPVGHALVRRATASGWSPHWVGMRPESGPASWPKRLGFGEGDGPAQLMVSAIGGNAPQAVMHDACRAISRGDLDVVLITGAEAMYARALARRDPARPWLTWASQPVGTPPPVLFGVEKPGASDLEMNRGVLLPVHAYPLLENALHAANGWTLDEHAARFGALWSRFSHVAAGNPDAWIRTARSRRRDRPTPARATAWSPFPYRSCARPTCKSTKEPGPSCARWRPPATRGCPRTAGSSLSPARMRTITGSFRSGPNCTAPPPSGSRAPPSLEQAGLGPDDVAWIDLYSCFPVVVQMAAAELGLAVDDPDRPLTLTGGLTFGGGPGNNYTSHGISARSAPCAPRRERRRSSQVSAGTPPSTHSGSTPRDRRRTRAPSRSPGATSNPRSTPCPRCAIDPGATGSVRVETYTVTFDRAGEPERDPRLSDARRHPGLGQHHRSRLAGAVVHGGRRRPPGRARDRRHPGVRRLTQRGHAVAIRDERNRSLARSTRDMVRLV